MQAEETRTRHYPFTTHVVYADGSRETWSQSTQQGLARADARIAYRWHRVRGFDVVAAVVEHSHLGPAYTFTEGGD